jgi:hypothetical protein
MSLTFAQLTQRVIASVGEVSGTSVQTYSEPRVREALEEIFEVVFRKYWWPQYMAWFGPYTLDGTIGIITDNTFGQSVKDIRDVKTIIPLNAERGIPQLPDNRNPFNITGTTVRYYEALDAANANAASRLIQFWPKSSTGQVYINARKFPTLVDSTHSFLDNNLMIFGASWLILEQEDINPNAAALQERMFNETFADIMKHYSEQPIENPIVGYSTERYLSEWFTQ